MKNFNILLAIIILGHCSASLATTVYLKDGRVVSGKINKETKYSITIDDGKAGQFFYKDEVLKIERKTTFDQIVPLEESDIVDDSGEVSDTKRELVLRLLTANGALEGIRQSMHNLVGEMSPAMREEFDTVLNADALTEQFIPVYAKYFTEQQLKEMIRFYSSETGKKLLRVTPKITEESFTASINYLKPIAEKKRNSQ